MNDEMETESFFRRNRTAIIVAVVSIVSAIVVGRALGNNRARMNGAEALLLDGMQAANAGRYPFGFNGSSITLNEAETELARRLNGRGGPIATTLVVDGVERNYPSRTTATKSINGSDGGISLAYSRGQEKYLDAIIK